MSASERPFDEAFKKMGVAFVTEVCLFHYTDAPVSFVIDSYHDVAWAEIAPGFFVMDGIEQRVEYASAKWKGELMFYDGAQIAFGAGTSVLCTDYCCN